MPAGPSTLGAPGAGMAGGTVRRPAEHVAPRGQVYSPPGFKIYGVPYVCGFAIFGAMFLIASLGPEAVWRFFIVLIVISFLYLVYGVHAAQGHDNDLDVARTCAPAVQFRQLVARSSHER